MVTALYRRYRPETFAEMIGQSQVTEPLMTALRTDRVNHAYLFSGPRGCGKTTSARILARCLNCAEGPTDTPCGVCPSCIELSRGGGGSLDVVEIDAASHNGVDDARDLRERAVFAPARDRYKIFILDEAHMVTPQGFNALLKLVEEPPEHVKFIFATTEPDKVLGTIRSRTHHYPFRLVPPGPMLEYVQKLCTEEGVEVAPGVLPLVVRAGGGSPRDTLSLLDQLIAGSEGSTIDYERAVALLGYTHGALLDEVVDAIGVKDAAEAFAAADRIVQTGQDPRRFVEDLLERLRDLIVVAASSPEAAAAVLRGTPDDELARMATQAAAFGPAELSRVADLVNQTLTEMTGATSPRLHLELMLARVLVPSSDDTERGALARVERLERRVGVTDAAGESTFAGRGAAEPRLVTPAPVPARSAGRGAAEPRLETGTPAAAAPTAAAPTAAAPKPVGPVTLQLIRDAWPEILGVLERTKRTAWMAAMTAKVIDYRADDGVLVLGFPSQNDVNDLRGGTGVQSPAELLRRAIADVLGVQVKFLPRVVGAQSGSAESPTSAPPEPGRPSGGDTAPVAPVPDVRVGAGARSGSGSMSGAAPAPFASAPSAPAPSAAAPSATAPSASAPSASAPSATAPSASASAAPVDSWATVAIPSDEPEVAAAPASSGGSTGAPAAGAQRHASAATATAVTEAPAAASDLVDIPDDTEAPPEDLEPPFDPGPPPEIVVDAAPATAPVDGGIQRYGEAVVREVLGATFLEEVEAPGRTGFGERG
ncbi:DNA polymerase III subunit gamma and tau [Agromyces bauzanensis]|uniref:DNA polymerase III subunit gamma/tau n=1 Tax=Agromyces bauzanensis TaxID=1308924 RepID=A0A917UWE3_9MICO|nr:DNA polymerase III subunit gamma and tau [Agromyces bauzanensis]GGJ90337.1 hypothetical protein GCM10011372_31100 [Agromyces bauzanensis]